MTEKPGYELAKNGMKTSVPGGGAAGSAGNVLIGGVVGAGIDAASGAFLCHDPNPDLVALEPLDPKKPKTPPGSLRLLQQTSDAEKADAARRKAAAEADGSGP